jgi:hypothetical protein
MVNSKNVITGNIMPLLMLFQVKQLVLVKILPVLDTMQSKIQLLPVHVLQLQHSFFHECGIVAREIRVNVLNSRNVECRYKTLHI